MLISKADIGTKILYAILAVLLELLVVTSAFIGTTMFLYDADRAEAQSVIDEIASYNPYERYISYEEFSSLDGTVARVSTVPFAHADANLSENQYVNLCRVYDEALGGTREFTFCNLSTDEIAEIMDALDFTYSKATWESRDYPDGNTVIRWILEDAEVIDNILFMQRQARDAIILSGVENGMDSTVAILKMNDYLCSTVEYDESLERHRASDAFAGSAVCSGYAEAFEYMSLQAGIPCKYVHGTMSSGAKHAWNLVNIDGEWLYIDVTNNDAVGANMYCLSKELWKGYTVSTGTDDFLGQ